MGRMKPSIESLMLRKGIGSMERDRSRCSACGRTPLVGEFLHQIGSGDPICGLCLSELPEPERASLSAQWVRAGERTLAVGRSRAA